MLKVPYFDERKRENDIVYETIIIDKNLIIPEETIKILTLNNEPYFWVTKGTHKDIFIFNKQNFEKFSEELAKPQYIDNPIIRKVQRHFLASVNRVKLKIDNSIYLGEWVEALKWPKDCKALLIYNENMIYKPISIKLREGK